MTTLVRLDEVGSTQEWMKAAIAAGEAPRAVLADRQTAGRGRFGRSWYGAETGSLAMSIAFPEYAASSRPWLVGMRAAIAVAGAIHARLRWPNDLFLDGKKVGGVLTELVQAPDGTSVPVVGIGVNVAIREFPPELAPIATSLVLHREREIDIPELAEAILQRLDSLPEPDRWDPLYPIWDLFDDTPGKLYRLPTGEDAVAIGVGPQGELVCAVDGETTLALAADAILGRS
ncbi:MAG TPA: biotin--[acetyl-CoA-carboxylase] ligase [Fimbriimonadaceae bacterium]|nr:biotin--[acetyl-CoA-carboxylase] ligase [Fimbriimonadaceae bacterium]